MFYSVEAAVAGEAIHSVRVGLTGVLLSLVVLDTAEHEHVGVCCFIEDDRHAVVTIECIDDCIHNCPGLLNRYNESINKGPAYLEYTGPWYVDALLKGNDLLSTSVVHLESELLELGIQVLT